MAAQITYPRLGELVDRPCIFCKRAPRDGETFGPKPKQWDFTGICPECWDETTAEPDEDDEIGGEA